MPTSTAVEVKDALYEICGLDGDVKIGPCGRVFPVVHEQHTDRFYVLDSRRAIVDTSSSFGQEEFLRMISEGRVTSLPEPLTYRDGVTGLYARRELLQKLGVDPNQTSFTWVEVADGIVATCAGDEAVEAVMDAWGVILLNQAKNALTNSIKLFEGAADSIGDADNTLDLARRAARNKSLRLAIFHWSGAILLRRGMYRRFEQLCNAFILPQYPNLTFDEVKAASEHCLSQFAAQPTAAQPTAAQPTAAQPRISSMRVWPSFMKGGYGHHTRPLVAAAGFAHSQTLLQRLDGVLRDLEKLHHGDSEVRHQVQGRSFITNNQFATTTLIGVFINTKHGIVALNSTATLIIHQGRAEAVVISNGDSIISALSSVPLASVLSVGKQPDFISYTSQDAIFVELKGSKTTTESTSISTKGRVR